MIKIILLLFIDNYKCLYFCTIKCKYSFYNICEYYTYIINSNIYNKEIDE